jgi:hypothetical protein
MALSGCLHEEPCFVNPVHVSLAVVPQDASVSPLVRLSAIANGQSCGCCGGKAPTHIVLYAWDLNGDGQIDRSGSNLTEVDVTPPPGGAAPTAITVTVTDSAGTLASDTLSLGPR